MSALSPLLTQATPVRAVRGGSSREAIAPGMVCEHCRDRSKIWD